MSSKPFCYDQALKLQDLEVRLDNIVEKCPYVVIIIQKHSVYRLIMLSEIIMIADFWTFSSRRDDFIA